MEVDSVINKLMLLSDEERFYKKYHSCQDLQQKQKMLEGPGSKYSTVINWIRQRSSKSGFYTVFGDWFKNEITIEKHIRCGESFWHNHLFYELIYVYSGTAVNSLGNGSSRFYAGDLLIIPPFVSHKIDVDENSLVFNIIVKKECWLGLTSASFLSGRLALSELKGDREGGNSVISVKCPLYSDTGKLLDVMISEFYGYNSGDAILVPLLEAVTGIIDRKLQSTNKEEPVGILADDIINYIRDNYQTVTLDLISDHFGYASAYMSKIIHMYTGSYFTDIVKKIRVNEACRILGTQNVRISEVANRVGYTNSVYFNKIFKAAVGMSPIEYKREFLPKLSQLEVSKVK